MGDKIFEFIKDNLKNPKLYAFLVIFIIVFLLLFPYIDANFFYYSRVEKRIEILSKVSELNSEQIASDPILESEYDNILNEISKQKDGSLGSIFKTNSSPQETAWKFILGGALSWFAAIICLFMKNQRWKNRIITFLCMAMIGVLLGWFFSMLPTIIDPMVNYVIAPILQIVLIGLIATSGSKKKSKNSSDNTEV